MLACRAGLPQCPVQKLALQREVRAFPEAVQVGAVLHTPPPQAEAAKGWGCPGGISTCGCTILSPQVLKSLNKTYKRLKRRPVTVDLDPKAVTCDELFGIIHPATREWKDGETNAVGSVYGM